MPTLPFPFDVPVPVANGVAVESTAVGVTVRLARRSQSAWLARLITSPCPRCAGTAFTLTTI